jgi:KipI family sensor histidine kinase inhibitor
VIRVLPYGDRALLVEVDSLDEVLTLYPALDAARRDGIGELVPAARSVLVTVDPARLSLGAAERWILSVAPDAAGSVSPPATSLSPTAVTPSPPASTPPAVTIPVVYNGDDLGDVAQLLGISVAEAIRRHTDTDWRVAFIGFSPGFAYLASASAIESDASVPRLHVPRRSTSRPTVPAGSVGLAGEFSGIYPRVSPGGWQLIGRTDAVLWDVTRQNPALLVPGTAVRFEAVE